MLSKSKDMAQTIANRSLVGLLLSVKFIQMNTTGWGYHSVLTVLSKYKAQILSQHHIKKSDVFCCWLQKQESLMESEPRVGVPVCEGKYWDLDMQRERSPQHSNPRSRQQNLAAKPLEEGTSLPNRIGTSSIREEATESQLV